MAGNAKNYQAIQIEAAKRELARRRYADYLSYVNGPTWKRTAFGQFLADEIQTFIETDTGHAYDILIILRSS